MRYQGRIIVQAKAELQPDNAIHRTAHQQALHGIAIINIGMLLCSRKAHSHFGDYVTAVWATADS